MLPYQKMRHDSFVIYALASGQMMTHKMKYKVCVTSSLLGIYNFQESIMRTSTFSQVLCSSALLILLGSPTLAAPVSAPLGNPAPDVSAQRTINITSDTRYVNVEQGEIVRFSSAGKTFTWHFDTLTTNAFSLTSIAPKEINVSNVRVYLSRNRTYSGGR